MIVAQNESPWLCGHSFQGHLLTFGAIVVIMVHGVLLVAVEADLLAVVTADVVPKLVVARPAEVVAVTSVVVLRAHKPDM